MIFGSILERLLERFWKDFGEVFGDNFDTFPLKSQKINKNLMKHRTSFENHKNCTLIKHFIQELIRKIGPAFFGNPRKSKKS